MRQDMANIPAATIDRIVIFQAGSPSAGSPLAQVPSACKTSTTSLPGSNCNVYIPLDAFYQVQNGNSDYFKCVAVGDRACGWDPTSKTERPDGPHVADITYVGVYVKINHSFITKLYGNTFPIEVASVQRLEPGQLTA
jgi:hypothetical protein